MMATWLSARDVVSACGSGAQPRRSMMCRASAACRCAPVIASERVEQGQVDEIIATAHQLREISRGFDRQLGPPPPPGQQHDGKLRSAPVLRGDGPLPARATDTDHASPYRAAPLTIPKRDAKAV